MIFTTETQRAQRKKKRVEHVTFKDFGVFSACAFVWLYVMVQVFNFFRPQQREIRMTQEYATRKEVEQVRADVQVVDGKVETLRGDIVRNGESRRIAIESKVEEARCESRESAGELQKDIAAVANDLSELKGETKMITQALARMEMRA